MVMEIKYLGHSAFEVKTNNKKILIDPFLIMCPDYKVEGITDIFVTHGHGDHLGSAIEISKQTGAEITAIFPERNPLFKNLSAMGKDKVDTDCS
jgi:L-ascorbate metabolism protein UlaG (beta-lactamase superfamily)